MRIYNEKDLFIILVWTFSIFPFIIIPTLEDSMLRTIIAIPIVLFIPGYLLISALFPKKDDLEIAGRVALSLGLSIVAISLLGLLLNFTFGLETIYMIIFMSVYNVTLVLYTTYRREKLGDDERFSIPFREVIDNITPKSKSDGILTGVLVFVIILAIGMAYIAIMAPKIGEPFTEFYLLNSSGKTDNYLTDLKADYPNTYLVGIINHEHKSINYRIDVVLDQDVLISKSVALNHGETWENDITFIPNRAGTDVKLEFLLFKGNLADPYRKLHIRVNSER